MESLYCHYCGHFGELTCRDHLPCWRVDRLPVVIIDDVFVCVALSETYTLSD